jgi:hypothetical protein
VQGSGGVAMVVRGVEVAKTGGVSAHLRSRAWTVPSSVVECLECPGQVPGHLMAMEGHGGELGGWQSGMLGFQPGHRSRDASSSADRALRAWVGVGAARERTAGRVVSGARGDAQQFEQAALFTGEVAQ